MKENKEIKEKKKSKDCKEVEELMYLRDQELTGQEMEQLSAHLDICAGCAGKRREFLMSMEILDQSTTVIIDDQHLDNMELSVMASIRQERRPRLNGIRILRWTSVVAASLLLMLFIGEQSYTVSKITRLEERLAGIDYTRNPELIDRLTILESREIIAKSLRAAYGKQLIGRPSTPFSFSAFAESKAWIDSLRQGGYFERYIPQRTNPFLHTAFIVKTK